MSEATTEQVAYRPGKLVPVSSPQELRERTVRDYARNAERAGIAVPTRALELLAVADCEMVDAYSKGIDRSPTLPKKPKAKPATVTVAPADGLTFVDVMPEAARRGRDVYYVPPVKVSARWPFAMGRMKRILAGATKNRDPIKAVATCEMPVLALATLRLHFNYLQRGRNSRHNPFNGMSDADAMRMLVRSIEDICDQSSSKLGAWWVPK